MSNESRHATGLSSSLEHSMEDEESLETNDVLDKDELQKPVETDERTNHGATTASIVANEVWKVASISLPAIVVQLSVRLVFTQTASCVGRVLGTTELAAFSLASLTANLTCLSVLMGALTAAETLMPRAYGAKRYADVGQLAIQALVVCVVLLIIPVIILCTFMEYIFHMTGQDDDILKLAVTWIRIYATVGVPFMLIFRIVQVFLNSQHVVLPLMVSSVIASMLVHPLLLQTTTLVSQFGLAGSAICVVMTQCIMVVLLFLYLRICPVYHPQTWPSGRQCFCYGSHIWKDALELQSLVSFCKLGLGGVLSLSEWWFWETVCFLVGSLGVVPLALHSVAYNVIPVVFMITVGLATGCTIRMGQELEHNVQRAKQIAAGCMACAIFLGALISLLLYQLRTPIVYLFATDERVLQGCNAIWNRVCMFVFILHIFSINRAILRALGMQWRIAAVVVTCVWCGALPTIIYKAVYLEQGLDAVWTALPLFYSIMQVLLLLSYTTMDWRQVCRRETRDDGSGGARIEFEMEELVSSNGKSGKETGG